MSSSDPTPGEALETLKRAVALLELSAQREAAERNALASADALAINQSAIAIGLLVQAIRTAAQQQPEVRQALQDLGHWLSSLAGQTSEHAAAASIAEVPSVIIPQTSPELPTAPSAPPQSSVAPSPGPPHPLTLRLGDFQTQVEVPGTAHEAEAARQSAERSGSENANYAAATFIGVGTLPDVQLMIRRCRLKAEGCHWAVNRRRMIAEGASYESDLRPIDVQVISRAKAIPNCYVWALDPRVVPPAEAVLNDFSTGYNNLAIALELADELSRGNRADHGLRSEGFALLAEAQSALRAGMFETGLKPDWDQNDAFSWLRTRTSEDRVLVQRHMKLEDPADLANGENLGARLEALRDRLTDRRAVEIDRRKLQEKARYHGKRIVRNTSDDVRADWNTVIACVDELVRMGIPPSDLGLREVMVPIIEALPEDLQVPVNVERVLESVDQYLGTQEAEIAASAGAGELRFRAPSPDVIEAASLLEGGVVVLIGGQRRPQSQQALERELKLAELRWIPAAHSQSHFAFEPAVARPDTVLVILAIRWSAHSFENVKSLCDTYGKPFVRLPGGYSPNQVSRQILEQAGETLRRNRQRGGLLRAKGVSDAV